MTASPEHPEPDGATTSQNNEAEIRRRMKQMRDDEIVDFLRETVAHLDALADRLELFAEKAVKPNREEPRDA